MKPRPKPCARGSRPSLKCAALGPPLLLAIAMSVGLVFVPSARAVGTRAFDLDTLDELSGGDLKGAMVDSLGHVRAGFDLGALPLGEASSIWSALVQKDGSVLLGTGNTGKVFRVAGGQVLPYADTAQLAVTSLVAGFGGAVFAATIPNGRIFRLDGRTAAPFVDLQGADHVWALAFDAKQNALFAATGPHGKIFRIDAGGHAQTYFECDEPHLVSVVLGPDGALYAGSSGKALLYRIAAPGRATVVFDLPGEELKALAFGPKGILYAASNEYGELPDIPKRSGGQTPAAPVAAPRPKPGKGTLTRFDETGKPERLLRREDTHFVSLAVGDDGRPYVGTGADGRVYSVDEAHTSMLVADTDERQVGAMVLAGGKRFVATSDPAVFHEVRGIGGADSVWTSKVLDAGVRARFGRLSWRATAALELSTRTGNTQSPDKTWSEWTEPLLVPGKVQSPPARFVQIRARFSRDASAVLSQVLLPFVTDNLRAVVTAVDAQPRNATPAVKDGAVPSSGGEPERHSSTIKLSWRVDNPDGDSLRYRLAYRFDGQTVFRDITRPDDWLTKTEYEWDTSSLPEGPYRVRVEATDELVNPPDRALRHALESAVILVDNTPPVFRTLVADGRRVHGDAVDGVGPIARIDVTVDGRTEWHPFLPTDGVFDEAVEAFDFDVSALAGKGNHLLAVRAFDEAGNFVVRSLELK
jgi:outer membrane protein assembly factor BamB